MLLQLKDHLPEIKPIHSDYGKGKQLAKAIIEFKKGQKDLPDDAKEILFENLWDLYEEVA